MPPQFVIPGALHKREKPSLITYQKSAHAQDMLSRRTVRSSEKGYDNMETCVDRMRSIVSIITSSPWWQCWGCWSCLIWLFGQCTCWFICTHIQAIFRHVTSRAKDFVERFLSRKLAVLQAFQTEVTWLDLSVHALQRDIIESSSLGIERHKET